MAKQSAAELWDIVILAAEKGWKVNFRFEDGTEFENAYITQIDAENQAYILERVGERHLKPKLAYHKDVIAAKLHW